MPNCTMASSLSTTMVNPLARQPSSLVGSNGVRLSTRLNRRLLHRQQQASGAALTSSPSSTLSSRTHSGGGGSSSSNKLDGRQPRSGCIAGGQAKSVCQQSQLELQKQTTARTKLPARAAAANLQLDQSALSRPVALSSQTLVQLGRTRQLEHQRRQQQSSSSLLVATASNCVGGAHKTTKRAKQSNIPTIYQRRGSSSIQPVQLAPMPTAPLDTKSRPTRRIGYQAASGLQKSDLSGKPERSLGLNSQPTRATAGASATTTSSDKSARQIIIKQPLSQLALEASLCPCSSSASLVDERTPAGAGANEEKQQMVESSRSRGSRNDGSKAHEHSALKATIDNGNSPDNENIRSTHSDALPSAARLCLRQQQQQRAPQSSGQPDKDILDSTKHLICLTPDQISNADSHQEKDYFLSHSQSGEQQKQPNSQLNVESALPSKQQQTGNVNKHEQTTVTTTTTRSRLKRKPSCSSSTSSDSTSSIIESRQMLLESAHNITPSPSDSDLDEQEGDVASDGEIKNESRTSLLLSAQSSPTTTNSKPQPPALLTKELLERVDIPIRKEESIQDNYDLDSRPFARGKFAQVKRCVSKTTNQCFAAKCIKKRRRLVDIRHEILLEIEALKLSYITDRIVKLYEVYETPNEIILILEMANGGELQRVLDDEESIDEQIVRRMVGQILEGLVYLHDQDIAHLDIKPQNLLLTDTYPKGSIKLCDFGISRRINKGAEIREICGTPDYVAPEILRYDPICLATDMWSLGVLTYVLLSGYSPFGSENKQQTFCNITQATLDFPSEIFAKTSKEAIDFIRKLIVREPKERLTSRQARNHPWLVNVKT